MNNLKNVLIGKISSLKYFIDFFLYAVTHSDVIVHVGFTSEKRIALHNIGDPILYLELEKLYDKLSQKKHSWLHLSINKRINILYVLVINYFTKGVIIGGHGLIMPDVAYSHSGWLFNISLNNLKRINKPIVFFAIGYNLFRTDTPSEIFKKHIEECIQKSVFFGLRNFGSIRSLLPLIQSDIRSKLVFQPCPTTMLSFYANVNLPKKSNEIGICLALDRYEKRFNGQFRQIFDDIESLVQIYSEQGYRFTIFVHEPSDMYSEGCTYIRSKGYNVQCLANMTFEDIYKFYMSKRVIWGMRGHSLMIPYGLGIPVISLTNQDKQKFFIETTNHPERSIELVNNKNLQVELKDITDDILNNYEYHIKEIENIKEGFYNITRLNIHKIESKFYET